MQHSFKGACVFTQPDTFLLFGVVLLSLRTFHIEFDTSRTIHATDSTFRLPMTLIVQRKKEQHTHSVETTWKDNDFKCIQNCARRWFKMFVRCVCVSVCFVCTFEWACFSKRFYRHSNDINKITLLGAFWTVTTGKWNRIAHAHTTFCTPESLSLLLLSLLFFHTQKTQMDMNSLCLELKKIVSGRG